MVAPLAGAWIEIKNYLIFFLCRKVAPLAGAWIEIMLARPCDTTSVGRSPRGSVD